MKEKHPEYMADCKFYNEYMRNCEALKETYCKYEDCSFYKKSDKNEIVYDPRS